MRIPLIAGNWKMYLDRKSALELARAVVQGVKGLRDRDVLLCPPFPLLGDVAKALEGSSVSLGAQNMHHEKEGAFTGEVSAGMLLSVSCRYVIIGHSERRHIFHEENDTINKKVLSAVEQGLRPVLCVGELLSEREAGNTETVVRSQVEKGLDGLNKGQIAELVVAYEPVWAIGTGKTATPDDANRVQSFIRGRIEALFGREAASGMRILYGGSVKPENIDGLMAQEHVDGALVGGASLKADSFLRIVNFKR